MINFKNASQIIREYEKRRNQINISRYYKPKNCPQITCLVEVVSGGEDTPIQFVGEELAGVHEGETTDTNSQTEKETEQYIEEWAKENFENNDDVDVIMAEELVNVEKAVTENYTK